MIKSPLLLKKRNTPLARTEAAVGSSAPKKKKPAASPEIEKKKKLLLMGREAGERAGDETIAKNSSQNKGETTQKRSERGKKGLG